MGKYIVIRDTREQAGWIFKNDEYCYGTEVRGLKTGDYTLDGYEDILCIERKGCISEFANNLVKEYQRFCRELERMEQNHKYCFILLEFDMKDLMDYPRSAHVSPKIRSRIRVTGSFLLKRLLEIEFKYKVKILFCGNHGKDIITSIFKRITCQQ